MKITIREVVVALMALLAVLALASCATSADVPTVLSAPLDSTLQVHVAGQQVLAQLTTGKLKITGPVIIQVGGAGNQANATNAPKAKSPVAGAPGATASAPRTTTKQGTGTPPWLLLLVGAVSIAAWEWLSHQVPATWLSWLPSRAKPAG